MSTSNPLGPTPTFTRNLSPVFLGQSPDLVDGLGQVIMAGDIKSFVRASRLPSGPSARPVSYTTGKILYTVS